MQFLSIAVVVGLLGLALVVDSRVVVRDDATETGVVVAAVVMVALVRVVTVPVVSVMGLMEVVVGVVVVVAAASAGLKQQSSLPEQSAENADERFLHFRFN